MKVAMKPFQDKAIRGCVRELAAAYERYTEDDDTTVVLLAAPTGSGKTLMTTATLEALFDGTSEVPERPTLRVLWLTDSPSLNQQSADKMDRDSDFLREGKNLVVIDESFDDSVLRPGVVHFAHIQQLTSTASSYWPNEAKNRKTALWHTIAKTVRDHGDDFLLIIDEAHKAIGKDKTEKQRPTILKTVLDGGKNLFDQAPQPITPVALVMTATPKRFKDATLDSDRVDRDVRVNIKDVQDSGLLKHRLRVETVQENQKAVHTLLQAGTTDLHDYETWWREERDATGRPLVTPVMVVQVENIVSAVDLGERVKTISDQWAVLTGKNLPERAFAHAFGEATDIKTPDGLLRYVEPNNIDSDSFVRVVFFKEALTTGWDCPRAEVMASLRTVSDPTTISQLVGRMVRTPFGVEADDPRLRSVVLYLPFYDQRVVTEVVSQIALDTEGALLIEMRTEPVVRNPTVPSDVYAAIDGLPKYVRPVQDYKNDVQRAADLSERLIDRGVVVIALDDAEAVTPEDELRDLILTEIERVYGANKSTVDARVQDLLELDTNRRTLAYAGAEQDAEDDSQGERRAIHHRDIDIYYSAATKKLPEGSGLWYFERLMTQKGPARRAKMRVVAVSELADIRTSLDAVARSHIQELRKLYEDRVEQRGLSVQFKVIWYPPTEPIETTLALEMPLRVCTERGVKKGDKVVPEALPVKGNHVFAFHADDDSYQWPVSTNSWEVAALDVELQSPTAVGWFRNPNSGKSALSVPYKSNGRLELMHPDFVFVHQIDGQHFVDIIDPHKDFGDARDKWIGLARYAATHSGRVRRAVAIARIGATDWGMNLTRPDVAAALDDRSQTVEAILQRLGNKRIKA